MSNMPITPDTMPLPALVAALSERCGVEPPVAEAFVGAFTETVATALRTDGSVRIKGIGLFSLDSDGNIVFMADETVADEINAPFSIFEPVEIDGIELPESEEASSAATDEAAEEEEEEATTDVREEDLPLNTEQSDSLVTESIALEEVALDIPDTDTEAEADADADASEPEPSTAGTADGDSASDATPIAEDSADTAATQVPETPTATDVVNNDARETTVHSEPHIVKVVVREHPWLTGILAGVAGVLLGLVAGYFLYPKLNLSGASGVEISAGYVNVTQDSALQECINETAPDSVNTVAETMAAPAVADTAAISEANTKEVTAAALPATQPTVVRDTVRGNRYLTTIARDHYGRKVFWVYIYEENKSVITDPDHIAPNTVVVVPPAEKYGIKAGDKISEQAAERKAIEILGNNR